MKNLVTAFSRSLKKRVGSALALILIASFFTFDLGAQTIGRRKNPLKNIKEARSEKGPRVGDRVKQLRAENKAVNAALEAFEKKGHKPKFDEAFSFTGKVEQPREVASEELTTRLNKTQFPVTGLRSFLSPRSTCKMSGRERPLQTSTMLTALWKSNTWLT